MFDLFCFSTSMDDCDVISASSVQYIKRSDLLSATSVKLPLRSLRAESKKSARERKRATVIGAPSDFRHNMHIGYTMNSDAAFKEMMDTAMWTRELGYRLPVTPPSASSSLSSTKESSASMNSPPWSTSSFDTPPSSSESTTAVFTQTQKNNSLSRTFTLPSTTSLPLPSGAPVRRPSTVRRKPVPPLIPEVKPEPKPIVETNEEEQAKDEDMTVESDSDQHSSASESDESGISTPADVDQSSVPTIDVVKVVDFRLRELLEAANLGSPTEDKKFMKDML